jgi:hypothetical protein
MGCASLLFAQTKLKPVTHFPKQPAENSWWFDSLHQKVGVYHGGNWTRVPTYNCKSVTRHNNFVFACCYPGILMDTLGNVLSRHIDHINGDDSVTFIYQLNREDHCINIYGDTLVRVGDYLNALHPNSIELPHLVQGRRAYCLPLMPHTIHNHIMYDLNTWGMIGVDGKWLIPPMFDEPFEFVNGTAEVLYYGQRRKINERGEFLDGGK